MEALTSAHMPGSLLLPCDVTSDAEIDAVFARVGEEFGSLDTLLHSVAYAPKEELEGDFRARHLVIFAGRADCGYNIVGL